MEKEKKKKEEEKEEDGPFEIRYVNANGGETGFDLEAIDEKKALNVLLKR